MSATHPVDAEVADARRPIDRLLGNYSDDHRNPVNQVVHWICVPAIVWTVVALMWVVPVPPGMGRPGLWAGLGMVAAIAYYLRLSRPIAMAMVGVFAALALFTHGLYGALGPSVLLWTAVAVFVVAWIAQFIGHEYEGKRPSFLTDVQYLLIGPIWLVGKTLRRLGIAY
jgi:uncharacterized membrane protein YGL010W